MIIPGHVGLFLPPLLIATMNRKTIPATKIIRNHSVNPIPNIFVLFLYPK